MVQTIHTMSPDPLQASANNFIATMAEINKLWDEEFTARREAVNELIESGYNIHISFYEYMNCIFNQSDKGYKALEAIKSELRIAKIKCVLDEDNMVELKANAEKLSKTVLLGGNYNAIIRSKIFGHKTELIAKSYTTNPNHHKKVIQDVSNPRVYPNVTFHNRKKDTEDTGFVIIPEPNSGYFPAEHTNIKEPAEDSWIAKTMKGINKLSPIISTVGDRATRLSKCSKSKKSLEDRILDLNILCQEMTVLQCKSEDFIRATDSLISSNLNVFIEFIENNKKFYLTRDSEVKSQASKMEEEAVKLQSCFKSIKVQAAEDARTLRRLVLLNNPEALLSQ